MSTEGLCTECDPPHGLNLCPDCDHYTTTDEGMAHHISTEHGRDVTPANWWKD